LDRALLVLGLRVRELGLHRLEPLVLELERLAFGLLAPGVESEQFAGELAQAGTGAALQVLPGLAPELGERGGPAVGADVARDLADLLVRDIEAVLAPQSQQQVVAWGGGRLPWLKYLGGGGATVPRADA